ncbi:twin-arginine translocase TatA/TatE family subunit [Isoptericola variabilis]|uniref:Sec-independent protein translocase protein TatA n=1 Tax=Isoptericola variabilis (strain 225) TaxID=743718 RepID=F6FUV9_ISOV2|nr:twin-arginine translocase TatA/TatE family subunit [Isoptericola variabilis]AEG44299.1 sec-independent translocation protein mttA/Hcf106 [Isoptericola variabilis 225]TWH28860.1 sec-independent protein translocase protein TatA [Isoptericola variabilis J7]
MNILRHPAVIIVLILLVVLLFGSRRLPDFARSVGQSLKIFKKEVRELKEDGKPAEGSAEGSDTTTPGATPGTPASGTSSSTSADASPQAAGPADPKHQG